MFRAMEQNRELRHSLYLSVSLSLLHSPPFLHSFLPSVHPSILDFKKMSQSEVGNDSLFKDASGTIRWSYRKVDILTLISHQFYIGSNPNIQAISKAFRRIFRQIISV